ncbi:MAG TPA: hypothetical protein VKE74_21380 [Gemmataceae bacterium]|nr:hypothetical protein [Gemmataceae bacterium]
MRDALPISPPRPEDSLALQAQALRYAAGDLLPAEAEAFEARLATDQAARDAIAEAVRLSAAALGQAPPAPDRSFREMIRERLFVRWLPGWLARRAYRGHPLAWAGLGAALVAVVAVAAVQLAGAPPSDPPASARTAAPSATRPAPGPVPGPQSGVVTVPAPRPGDPTHAAVGGEGADDTMARAAELWAEMSTPDHVEKTVEEEAKWKQRLRDLQITYPGRPAPATEIHE